MLFLLPPGFSEIHLGNMMSCVSLTPGVAGQQRIDRQRPQAWHTTMSTATSSCNKMLRNNKSAEQLCKHCLFLSDYSSTASVSSLSCMIFGGPQTHRKLHVAPGSTFESLDFFQRQIQLGFFGGWGGGGDQVVFCVCNNMKFVAVLHKYDKLSTTTDRVPVGHWQCKHTLELRDHLQ